MSASAAVKYQVRYRVSGSNGDWSAPADYPVSSAIQVQGLQRNTDYDFEVRAVSACGASSAWVPSDYSVPSPPPPRQPQIGGVYGGANTIIIDWSDDSSASRGDIQYEVQRAPADDLYTPPPEGSDKWVRVAIVGGTTWVDVVTDKQHYWYRIRTVDYAGNVGPWIILSSPAQALYSMDIEAILNELAGRISDTQLAKDLLDTINNTSDQVVQQAAELQDQANQLSGLKDGITNIQKIDDKQNTVLEQLNTTTENQQTSITNIKQTQSDQAEQLNSVSAKVNIPSAGEMTNDSDGSAGSWSTMESAGYYNYTIASVDADRAMTERMDTLTSTVSGNTAAVQTTSKAISEINGRIDATFEVKVQATSDGKLYLAGIGAGVSNETGGMQSQIFLLADRIAFIREKSDGGISVPFVEENGNVIIDKAFIGSATIDGGMVANQLKSDSWDLGNGGICLDFRTGAAHFTNVEVEGNVTAQSITGHFQRTSQGQRDDSVYGPPEGSSDIITLLQIDLPPPYRGDQQHVPQLSANFDTYADRNHKTAICGIVIQRDYNDNNWQTVRSSNIGLHGNNSGSFTLQWMGDRTGSYTRYRLALTELGQNDHADQVLFSSFYMSAVGIV